MIDLKSTKQTPAMKRNDQGKFTTDKEPMTAKISLRIEPSTLKKFQEDPDWQEKIREFVRISVNTSA